MELRLSDPSGEAPWEVVATETVDVSAHGLRMLLPGSLRPDCLFDMCVEIRGSPRLYLLTAESRWCRYLPERGLYEAGFLIHDGVGTDYPEWTSLFPEAQPPSAS